MDLEIFTNKIGESGQQIIRRAYEAARLLKHAELFPEHVLIAYAEVERSRFETLRQKLNIDPQVVLQVLSARLGKGEHAAESMKLSMQFRILLINALKHAKDVGQVRIEANDLLEGVQWLKKKSTTQLSSALARQAGGRRRNSPRAACE